VQYGAVAQLLTELGVDALAEADLGLVQQWARQLDELGELIGPRSAGANRAEQYPGHGSRHPHVAELDVETSLENHRWLHPSWFVRVRHALQLTDVFT
jgi:hypothetical protein